MSSAYSHKYSMMGTASGVRSLARSYVRGQRTLASLRSAIGGGAGHLSLNPPYYQVMPHPNPSGNTYGQPTIPQQSQPAQHMHSHFNQVMYMPQANAPPSAFSSNTYFVGAPPPPTSMAPGPPAQPPVPPPAQPPVPPPVQPPQPPQPSNAGWQAVPTDAQPPTYKMFLARVLTGQFCQGSPRFKRPPEIEGMNGMRLYDSCVDHVDNPNLFVVFENTHSYPEYLIEYTVRAGKCPHHG